MVIINESVLDFTLESAVEVVVVEHFTDDAFVVVVTLDKLFAVDETTLLSSVLGEDLSDVEVEEVDGGWSPLSIPLSCWSKLFDLVDDVEGWEEPTDPAAGGNGCCEITEDAVFGSELTEFLFDWATELLPCCLELF